MTPTVDSRLAFVVAVVLIAVGDALYVTDLSRSTGVVVLAVSITFVGLGALTLWRGKRPARGWLIAVALALAVLLALGIFTAIYSVLHGPVSS
jgi:fatty acid desaturase